MFRGVTIESFKRHFPDAESCLQYLAELKWQQGFRCKKCGGEMWWKGKRWLDRRCHACNYNESPTAGTLFHKVKFSLLTAFQICFRLSVSKKGMSSCEISREYGIRQTSAWYFKRKVQEGMQSSEQFPLQGRVEVDEFVIGGKEEGNQGRAKGDRKIILIAVEKVCRNRKTGRAYAQCIENYSSTSFQPFMEKHIDKKSRVVTDGWTAYAPLKTIFPRLEQVESGNGKNFPHLHTHIMNFKGWLRGIHHRVSENHMQAYLNEFHFRFNRRNHLGSIMHKLLSRMVAAAPLFLTLRELNG
ncbi:IS1595 family transposase [Chitinophaga sp. LS1]|uniref:IS1595 family transposase n=1 Tax=Chitinophaga sp. LS1 TaxID=3051176 RepID=UPI002AABD3EA|nr:IS1595 family transposase [Chitinophaga sp. LS1]WPV67735.1 IS1595 family transposase [Chitinophaga sp. LS1]WPV67798.1 IS1595 family transposase [Chitinophaga sp. LS1]